MLGTRGHQNALQKHKGVNLLRRDSSNFSKTLTLSAYKNSTMWMFELDKLEYPREQKLWNLNLCVKI